MRWSYTIGRVRGTEVKVHLTFLLLLAWFGWLAYASDGPRAAVAAVVFLLAFFCSILAHEFGHIAMAARFGIRTPDVILLPIGGVARIERIPDEPRQELLIALAGPAVTLALVLLLGAYAAATGQSLEPRSALADDSPIATRLLVSNALVLLFNLIPAFPLDGGRVFRALLASRFGLVRATRIAGTVGQAFALLLGVMGVVFNAPLTLLVAFFIFLGAGAEASAVATRVAGQGLQVSQMMVTQFRTIPIHASLDQAVDLLLSGEQREFPVVDNLGRTEGMLTRDHLIRGLRTLGPRATVAEAMIPSAPTVPLTLGFQEALERLRASGLPALPVVDAAGALVGMLTMDNITELLLVRQARG